ncbi:MAG: KH domain-containing protein, partial [Candidatus Nanohaloarchaea archaeon]
MIEKEFIERGITKAKLEEYLEEELRSANYSHIDITKTPTSTNIIIYSEKPGLVIGRGGSRINEIIEDFEERFGIENPQVDAQELDEPDLDA